MEEQADLKKAFLDAIPGSDSDDSGSDEESESESERDGHGGLGGLTVKRKADKFDAAAPKAASKALEEYFGRDGGGGEGAAGGGGGPASKEDAFLRDFLINQKWKEDDTKLNIIGGNSDSEVGPARCCSPRHRMSFNSRHEGSKCVWRRVEQHLAGPTARRSWRRRRSSSRVTTSASRSRTAGASRATRVASRWAHGLMLTDGVG